jgi:thioredoxin 1
MKTGAKIAIVALLAVAVAATFALRGGKRAEYAAAPDQTAVQAPEARRSSAPAANPSPGQPAATPEAPAATGADPTAAALPVAASPKPRILELGSMRCQACLEMAKVLDALRASQGAKLQVDFIDVFEEPAAADRYEIAVIPTQILYDGAGKEIFRHRGFFSQNDILAKFRELGVKL